MTAPFSRDTPNADFVYALAIAPGEASMEPGLILAARATGLYGSTDNGVTWRSVYDSLNLDGPLMTTAVAVAPDGNDDSTMYIFAGVMGGVMRSSDGGESWHIAPLPTPPPTISALVISPDFMHDGTLIIGTFEDGVFRSEDRGRLWTPGNFGLLDLNVLSLAISPGFAQDETLFAGTDSGIFHSTNGGRAWHELDFPMDFAPVLSLTTSPNYLEDGLVFAGTEAFGLFRSTDHGHTWTRLGESVVTRSVNQIILAPLYPEDSSILVLHNDTVLVSRDSGDTWSPWKDAHSEAQGVAVVAAPHGLEAETSLFVGVLDGRIERL